MSSEENEPTQTPADGDAGAKNAGTEGSSPGAGETAGMPAATPPEGPNESEVRRELGIGGSTPNALDPSEVERLLEGALEGYGDILAQVDSVAKESSKMDAPVPSRIPALGAELIDQNLELLRDVHLQVKVELGRGRMYLKDILRLGQGSVVELERLAGDPLDIYVNDKVIARGEVLVLNESFCIRITEVFNPEELRQAI